MTRRHAAWLVTQASLVAGGAGFFAGWLKGAQTPYEPKFFSKEEFKAVDDFTAILIPTDETPGAREAQVAQFIDFVVNASAEYAPENQQHWREAMTYLKAHSFFGANAAQQLALVEQMSAEGQPHFNLIKGMTVHAFYTSRVGLVDVLEYKGLAYLTAFPPCGHPEHA